MNEAERSVALEYEHITALYESWHWWNDLRSLELLWEAAMGDVQKMRSVRDKALRGLSRFIGDQI